MQNRYIGDVGDFGKLGLLRWLTGETSGDDLERLTAGIIWYMFHDERHDGNPSKISYAGKHVSYLDVTRDNVARFGRCDPELWAKLGQLVAQDRRCVHCLQVVEPLPGGSPYYSAELNYVPRLRADIKGQVREHWLREANRAMRTADIVCLDPDNGVAPEEKMFTPLGPKFAYLTDMQMIWRNQKSLVVYQSIDREGPGLAQMEEACCMLREGLDGSEPIPMWFRRGTARVFYVIPRDQDRHTIRARCESMLESAWGLNGHFSGGGG